MWHKVDSQAFENDAIRNSDLADDNNCFCVFDLRICLLIILYTVGILYTINQLTVNYGVAFAEIINFVDICFNVTMWPLLRECYFTVLYVEFYMSFPY